MQFTRHTHRHGVAGRVKDQGAGVPDRLANGHALTLRVAGGLPEGHVHCRFGGAVQVQGVHSQNLARSLHLVLLQCLARADHVAQGLGGILPEAGISQDAARRRRRDQRRKHSRHKVHRRDGLLGNHARQAVINRAVADGNALRPARGAGSEENVSILVQAGFHARKLLSGGC